MELTRGAQGLLFDFDGLIIDTETPVLRAWTEAFERCEIQMPLELWVRSIGARDAFDPLAYLRAATGLQLPDLDAQVEARITALIDKEMILPGVGDYLDEARSLSLKLAVVSSSTTNWVEHHLRRLGLLGRWDALVCADDPELAKPSPALYLRALEVLNVPAQLAVAFEDSRNGVAAAKGAGLFCVAVPHGTTADLDLSSADLTISSLSDIGLVNVLALAEQAAKRA